MLAVGKDNFEEVVLQGEGVVLVDFWSEGCEPCKALMPDIEELAAQYTQVTFTKLDAASNRRLAIKERVLGLPTIAIYKGGQKVDEVTKEDATRAKVEAMIQKYI